jgi:lauroyl/myristoyl acyltransferase
MSPSNAILAHAESRESVFNPFIDRLLRLNRGDRLLWLSDVRAGIDQFPAMAGIDRRIFLRQAAINDAINRIAFRGFTRFPGPAKALARLVPIVGGRSALRDIAPNRPIVLALMHFGPIHFVFTVLLRMLTGRKLYALHAGGETGEAAHRYLAAIGCTPLVTDEHALRVVTRAMSEDPHCAVVVSFDYLGGRSRKSLPFLGSSVPAARGVAFVADRSDAVVVTAWGEPSALGLRVAIGDAFEIDRALPKGVRQDELMTRLFSQLEERLRIVPEQWTEWHSCSPRARDSSKESVGKT